MNRPIGLMAMVLGLILWFSPHAWANHGGGFVLIHGADGDYADVVDGKLQVEAEIDLQGATIEGGGTSSTFGAAFPSDGTAIGCSDGVNMVACGTAANPWTVNLGTIAGAATAANQTTIIGHVDGLETSLSSIDGKLPSALVGGRLDINIGASGLTLSVRCRSTDDSGFEACGGGGAGGGDGTIIDGNGAGEADVIGSNPAGTEQGLVVRNIPSGTQPVSAASLPLPTGAATEATLASALTALQLIDNIVSGAGVNITQMNGVNVSMGNGTTGTGTQRVTISSDSTGQVAIASLPNEGQQTMANSISVTIASNQTGVPVDSELSAAALLADNMSVPTTSLVGAVQMCHDGTNIDFCKALAPNATASPQVSCTTTSATLIASNGSRWSADLTQIASGTVYVCRSATCTTGTAAFIFTAQGQSYHEQNYSGVYSCITPTGTVAMAGSEVTS